MLLVLFPFLILRLPAGLDLPLLLVLLLHKTGSAWGLLQAHGTLLPAGNLVL